MRGRPNRDKPTPLRLLPPCAVCCQRAAGFHYGVTTCEACKGFFRRSLLRKEPYKCVRTEECRIGAGTARRQMCSKCRYDKCMSVGMSKDAIKTGRYSLLKKSKDIYDLLQHQQSSASGTLDEELRMKAKQTLDKINRTKLRNWSKYCGDLTLSVFVSSSKAESDLRSSHLQNRSTEGFDKITKNLPRNDITHGATNGARTSVQHEALPDPRSNSTSTSSADDINHYETSRKFVIPVDGSRQYNSFPSAHRHEWNQTLPATGGANPNGDSSGYPYPPSVCQCVRRFASFYHNNGTGDHPHSRSHIADGPFANWSGNHCIHSKEYIGTDSVSDPGHIISIGSMQKRDHRTSSHGPCNHEIKDRRSSPSPAYSYRQEQDDSPHSFKLPRDRSLFSEKGQNSPCTFSEPIKDRLPIRTETISLHPHSLWNRSQNGTSQDVKQKLQGVQNFDNHTSRFLYPCHGETDSENAKMPEVTFEKLIAQSIAGTDKWEGYGWHNYNDKDCNDVDASHIDKRSNDESSVREVVSRDVLQGYDVMSCEQEQDNQSGLKSRAGGLEDNRSKIDFGEHRQKIRSTKEITTLPSEIPHDIRFSIFDDPMANAGTDAFDLSFIETFPYASYEKNVLKSILKNYSDSVAKDAVPNRRSITSAIRSMWQSGVSETIETWTPAQNTLPQRNESNPCLTLSTSSAFTAENLNGFNFSDYDSTDLEDVISGLIKSHETTIGLDNNCLSERQIQTAHSVFQGLCRLKQELLGPLQRVDSQNSWKSSDTDWNGRRDMFGVYSLRSNANLPKVITFYRSIPGFMHLSSKDKVTLVRGAIGEFMFLSSFRGLDHKRLTLVDATNLMTIDMSTLLFAFPVFGELFASMHEISQELKQLKLSKDIVIVLKAISLMTPDRPCLEKPEQVKEIYKRLHACLKLLLEKQHSESGVVVYDKIGALFQAMQLSVGKFMLQRDDNLKKVLEDTPVPLLKETLFHFLFE